MSSAPTSDASTATPAKASSDPTAASTVALTSDGRPALSLTDFVDLNTLAAVEHRFNALTHLQAVIRDAQGQPVVPPNFDATALTGVMQQLITDEDLRAISSKAPLEAPIVVQGQKIGTITIQPHAGRDPIRPRLRQLAQELGLTPDKADLLLDQAQQAYAPAAAAAVDYLYLMATGIAQRCYDEHRLRRRVEELSALYEISRLMSSARSLEEVLATAARAAATTLNVKAASIRLLNEAGTELIRRASFGLSDQYVGRGPIVVLNSDLDRETLNLGVTYVQDMARDPRIASSQDARREGLVSVLNVAMTYRDRPIGVIRLYSAVQRAFEHHEVELIRAVAQLLAATIDNARLNAEHSENQRVQRQLKLAAQVQQRMLPAAAPNLSPFDIAARCVPSHELAGDFYDFIQLEGHLGIAVGDVAGKGVAASLLMASVRSALRAYAQDVYDLDEIVSRVNIALTRDTLDNEFATVFYGVLDPQTLRLTYCNAGHEPALLLRNNRITELDIGGMIVGIDAQQAYEKGLVDLRPDDLLLIHTDGLTDATNFEGGRFGRQRLREALRTAGKLPHKDAATALNHILWEVRRFTGLQPSSDDLTLVLVRVTKTK